MDIVACSDTPLEADALPLWLCRRLLAASTVVVVVVDDAETAGLPIQPWVQTKQRKMKLEHSGYEKRKW